MPPEVVPQMIAALAFFGLLAVCPLVMLFLRHQRIMAQMFHGNTSAETLRRLEALEHELSSLKAAHHELALKTDEQQASVRQIT